MNAIERVLRSIPAAGALLAPLILLALGTPDPARGASHAGDAAAGMERFAATVTAVDPRAGTLDLLTGVGFALRIRRVHMPASLTPRGTVPESAVVVLTPGCIVQVECRTGDAGAVASSVRLLRAAPRPAPTRRQP